MPKYIVYTELPGFTRYVRRASFVVDWDGPRFALGGETRARDLAIPLPCWIAVGLVKQFPNMKLERREDGEDIRTTFRERGLL